MHQGGDVFVFIDSQNLVYAAKSTGWEIDFQLFYRFLKDKFRISSAFLFIGYIERNAKLYERLEQIGFKIIFKPTTNVRHNGEMVTKGNVDAELVLHTMIQFPNFEHAIIISGDGDFYCLARYLIEQNKMCWLMVPNRDRYSVLLRHFAQYIWFLNQHMHKFAKRK